MSNEEIKDLWSEEINIQFQQIEKGIDEDGWYSNERNGEWMPMQAVKNWNRMDLRNNNTEIRPKSLSNF